MKTKVSIWSIVRDFINSKHIGEYITRQELLNEVNRRWGSRFSPVTVDCIRNMSTKLDYLDATKWSGNYIVCKHFSETMSMSKLRRNYDFHMLSLTKSLTNNET